MRLGMIGLNDDNGHPFSFSAIVNGYSDDGFADSGWPGIHHYLRARDSSEFGYGDVEVTHAWTQDAAATARLCRASLIEHAVERWQDMIGSVDGLLLARHDHNRHAEMALPFLEAGIPVFVDKPLTLDVGELATFRPYLENGKLMSCSGLRYARELDALKAELADYGPITLVRGAVVLDWVKYGVHMIDAVLSLDLAPPVSVTAMPGRHASMAIALEDGALVQIDALGDVAPTFQLDVFGGAKRFTCQIVDNFTAFRRCIGQFIEMVRTGTPPIVPDVTMTSMKTLIAGLTAREEGRTVSLREIAA